MAQLKDSLVTGSLRVTDTTYTNDLIINKQQDANKFFASSSDAASTPSWRVLAPADLPKATTTDIGGVSIGTGLSVSNGALSLYTNSNTSTALYPIGVASDASNTLLYDTSISMNGATFTVGSSTAGHIWCGTSTASQAGSNERKMGVANGSGQLYLFAQPAINGEKGLYAFPTTLSNGGAILKVNQNNKISQLADIVCTINLLAGSISSALSTTAGVETYTTLTLGNSTATTSTDASTGKIILYSSSAYSHTLIGASATQNRIITLPDETGTMALTTSNITGTAANVTGIVAIANGGTGATTATGARTAIENGNYLECDTAEDAAEKTITTTDDSSLTGFTLNKGVTINVVFTNTNTEENPTLSIAGTTGKAIYYKGVRVKYQGLAANKLYRLTYDGTYWQVINEIIPDFASCGTAYSTTKKVVTCPGFVPYVGARIYIKFTHSSLTTYSNSKETPYFVINSGSNMYICNKSKTTYTSAYRFIPNQYYEFIFDGTNLILADDGFQRLILFGKSAIEEVVDPNTGEVTTPASAAVSGYDAVYIGNHKASNTDNGLTGQLRLYNSNTAYINISAEKSTTSTSRAWYLPNTNSTRYFVTASENYNNNGCGDATTPVYLATNSTIGKCSLYAGGTAVTLNGTSKAASTASFYAPADAGTSGYLLQSTGSGAPTWIQATNTNIANTIVKRDAGGGFSAGSTTIDGNTLYVGSTSATAETSIILYGKDGSFSLYSHASDGSHGLWAHAHGTDTSGKSIFHLDTNNNTTFYGNLSGNATTSNLTDAVSLYNASAAADYTQFYNALYFGAYRSFMISHWNDSTNGIADKFLSGWLMAQLDSAYSSELMVSCTTYDMYLKTGLRSTWSSNPWKHIWVEGNSITGAVWNDYAEYRASTCNEPGYCVFENGDDTLSKTTTRLQHFAGITSDTWGFAQGETETAKTPIAVSGRVLAYTYRDRNEYKPGDCVCAAPDGTVDIMTRDEVMLHPDKIVGTVSCVPDYEEWGGGTDRPPIKVNKRIWIKVK